jgi:Na+-driven multidrug efflux pump/anti-sigma regulatory factor (Ser/Thr protein kinase)
VGENMEHVRNKRLMSGKIVQYLFPGIMMAMALQLGNIVDTMMVGNLLGTDAMSAISLALPVDTIIQIPGYCLGTGGAIAVGIMLGKRERKNASQVFTLTFLITLLFGIIFAGVAYFVSTPIANALASGGKLAPLVHDYIFVCMLGAPIIGIGLLMVNFLGVENHPALASAYLICSNVVNLVCDFIFLKYTTLGISGAALSTVVGFLAGMVLFIFYIKSPKRMIGFCKVSTFSPLKSVLVSGAPIFIFMIMNFIKSLGMNLIIINFIGDDGMAIYTVCENVLMIVEMFSAGIIGIIPNMVGILYGEKDYANVRLICRKVLLYSAIVCAVLFVLIMSLAYYIVILFGVNDGDLLNTTVPVLRIFIICLPAYVWNKFLISYYESIEESKQASIITFLQNGIFVLPVALLAVWLEVKFGGSGLFGLAAAFVISEFLTSLCAFIYRRIKHKKSDVLIIPKQNLGICLDMSIKTDMQEVPTLLQEVKEFCLSKGISGNRANLITIATEEMIVNCIKYGGKSSHWIDLSVIYDGEKLMLRIRDNGKPFNPVEYESDGDEFDIHGIELLKKISSKINHIRSIDLNNTVIEFDK